MLDFMGLAVNIISSKFEKHTLVIDLKLMPGSHNAENIIIAINDLVNRYSLLDKSKIYCNLNKLTIK